MSRTLLSLLFCMGALSNISAQTREAAYNQWITNYYIYNEDAAFTNDFDSDGVMNGEEWGFGGDPTNSNDKGIISWHCAVDGTNVLYIHPRLTNTTARPVYTVLANTNLISGTNFVQVESVDYTETSGGAWSAEKPQLEIVTNMFSATESAEFFRLQIALKDLPYLSQDSPGQTSQIFAPGIISRPNTYDQNVVWSPDGLELLFAETDAGWNGKQMWYAHARHGQWTDLLPVSSAQGLPESSFFYSPYNGTFPHNDGFSVDGETAYFPMNLTSIWKTQRTEQGWTEPVDLNITIPSEYDIWYVSATDQGTLYIILANAAGTQSFLYRARCINGSYQPLENLSAQLGYYSGFYVIVAPDESWLIASMLNAPGGYGGNDLWISLNDGQDNWTQFTNLGPQVNTFRHEIAPHVSRDGQYLFFARRPWNTTTQYADSYWIETSAVLPASN